MRSQGVITKKSFEMLPRFCYIQSMWHWIRDHHRKKILDAPFPAAWDGYVTKAVPQDALFSAEEKKHLRELVQVFVAEKHWEGCGGLILTDEIRVTIASQACLLILALPHDLYTNVDSILIYPSSVLMPEQHLGVFEIRQAPVHGPVPILGQAHVQGPVIVVWDAIQQDFQHPEHGHNVVYHEFAHTLDMLDGQADGTPPLDGSEQYKRWATVCEREFLRLRALAHTGKRTFLDAYGAVNEAEFFAVATEQFFDRPEALQRHSSDLYEVLREFYRQDPARRAAARPSM
jgi:Mlc titration factor MtfA (ptsG expression regulator)